MFPQCGNVGKHSSNHDGTDRGGGAAWSSELRPAGLSVAASLHRFVEDEALPGSGVDSAAFWEGAGAIVHDLAPRNRELVARREELQSSIDAWHREHPGRPDASEDGDYTTFLREIGYLLEEPADVAVTTEGVDDEVARIAGPQLVVPLLNARFATNAVNARWGSLYDALYGSDVVSQEGDLAPGEGYKQGARRRGDRPRPGPSRRALPARLRLARRRHGVRRRRRRPGSDGQGRRPCASPSAASSWATVAPGTHPRRCSWSTTACTSRSRWTTRTRSAGPTPRASRTCWWSRRSPRSWTSRTPSPPWTPRTRSSATATGST